MYIQIFKKKIKINISQFITLMFMAIILLGTTLLAMPFASRSGKSCGILTALFTATSSVCVTGLSLVDVWSTWNSFGQVVLLSLIEIGGLGFMSIVSLAYFFIHHQSDIQSLSIMAESLGNENMKAVGRIQKRLLIGSFIIEGAGAILLFVIFLPKYGVGHSLWLGVFHSVSAFCNAGFDVMGFTEPGSSLISCQNNPLIAIVLSVLIILGGIGFTVWDDILNSKRIRSWSAYTKMVVSITAGLLAVGTFGFLIMEFNNPNTIGNMPWYNKIANALFQSVTPRTAGFAMVDQASLTSPSKALTSVLMMVGGSAGSTAGGIKTVTFLILINFIISKLRGKKNTVIFHRTITEAQILNAFTIVCSFVALTFVGSLIMSYTAPLRFSTTLFESVSALSTAGLSLGITSSLSISGKIVAIIFMFLGRVGILTVSLGFFKSKENPGIKYPSAKIMF